MLDLTQATLQEWAMKNGLDANIKTMTQAEKTMLRYQYVMANSARAQGDFARTSKTWHNQVVILKQQLQQLAAVIGSGLIQAIKPFVIQMNNALSGLIKFAQNVVNALGKIFGWEMEVNTKGLKIDDEDLENLENIDTSGLQDTADASNNAAEAVKNLKDQLQGFDKLNVLRTQEKNPSTGTNNNNKDNGNGSGSNAGAGVSGGEALAALKKTKSLFESNIDNLFDLGRYISDTLKKSLASIKWNEIYAKARNFGKGLAEFLNGLITPGLFMQIGRTLAGVLNTAFHFLDSFGQTFDWSNFGKSIAAGINGFFSNIDWKTIFSTAKTWGSGIADAINSFFKDTDFYKIGKAVANAIKTGILFYLSLGSGIKWKQVATKLADGINGILENFPAKDLAETINVWVLGIRDLFVTLIKKIKWDKLADAIKELLSNIDPGVISIALKGLALIKGASFVLSVGSALLSEISKQFITKLAAKLLPEMAGSKTLQDAIGGGLGKAAEAGAGGGGLAGSVSGGSIAATLGGITAVIAGLVVTFNGFLGLWNNGWNLASGAMTAAGTGIVLAGLAIVGVLTGGVALAIAGVTAAFAFFAVNHEQIIDGMKTKLSEFKDSWTVFKDDASQTWTDLKTNFADVGKGFAEDFNKLKTNISNAWSAVKANTSETWDNVKTKISTAVSTLKTNAETGFNTLKTNVSNVWNGIKSNTSETWNNVKSKVTTLATEAKTTVSNAWDTLKTKTSTAFDSIKNIASDLWDDIKDSISDKISDAKDAVHDAIEDMKDFFHFKWKLPDLKLPSISIDGEFSLNPPSAPSFHLRWHRKAYDNPFMFTKPTVVPTMDGFGDGNGGEMVYGHANLMNDIREASGSSEMTAIGNRQLALLQRQNSILTAILEKEFGISEDAVFNAVRNKSADYTMRTGRGAFEF